MSSEKKRSFWRALLDGLASFILWICNVRVRIEGKELLPEDGRFLLVSNHLSAFDPIVLIHLLKKRGMLFVSKPENFKIPIAGFLMKKSGFLAIDRDNARNAIGTIYEAADYLAADSGPVVIYPEGTRNKTPGNGLLPFHNGVFKIAKRAKAPVVVTVVTGTDKVKDGAPFKRTGVALKILDVIDSQYVSQHNDKDTGDRAYAAMSAALGSGNDAGKALRGSGGHAGTAAETESRGTIVSVAVSPEVLSPESAS